jgi:hypothetical protein
LAGVARLVKSLAETSLAYLFHITNNAKLPPEVLAPHDGQHISRYALIHVQEQWPLVQQGTPLGGPLRNIAVDFATNSGSHLLLERLWMADEPLMDTDDFDVHWIPDRSFRDALPAQVLPELKRAKDLPQLSFLDLVARFEAYFDGYSDNAGIRRAIDDVLHRLDSLRTATSDSIPVIGHPGHPKVRPARLVKRQEPKRNRVQYHCSHCTETGYT